MKSLSTTDAQKQTLPRGLTQPCSSFHPLAFALARITQPSSSAHTQPSPRMLQAATATARPLASGRGATTMPAAQAAVRRGVHALRPALPLTPPPIARRPHPSRRRLSTARVSAFLSSDGGASVGSLLTSAAVAVSVSAGLVALYNDSAALGARRRRSGRGGGALPPPAEKQLLPAASDDNLRWAVMGVVSCLPLFNWMVRDLFPDLVRFCFCARRDVSRSPHPLPVKQPPNNKTGLALRRI